MQTSCKRCGRIIETDIIMGQIDQEQDPATFVCSDCRVKKDNRQLKDRLSHPPYHLCTPPCKRCRTENPEPYTPTIKGTALEPPVLQHILPYPNYKYEI